MNGETSGSQRHATGVPNICQKYGETSVITTAPFLPAEVVNLQGHFLTAELVNIRFCFNQ